MSKIDDELNELWQQALVSTCIRLHKELQQSRHNIDRVEVVSDLLSGQSLSIFRGLASERRKFTFTEVAKFDGAFIKSAVPDRTILRALERLESKLRDASEMTIEISDRRVMLVDLRATDNPTGQASMIARRIIDNTHALQESQTHAND